MPEQAGRARGDRRPRKAVDGKETRGSRRSPTRLRVWRRQINETRAKTAPSGGLPGAGKQSPRDGDPGIVDRVGSAPAPESHPASRGVGATYHRDAATDGDDSGRDFYRGYG